LKGWENGKKEDQGPVLREGKKDGPTRATKKGNRPKKRNSCEERGTKSAKNIKKHHKKKSEGR